LHLSIVLYLHADCFSLFYFVDYSFADNVLLSRSVSVITCSDEDEVISVGWIDTVRASLNDNQRQSQHFPQPINGQRQSTAPVTSQDDVKPSPPRPITLVVLRDILPYSPNYCNLCIEQ